MEVATCLVPSPPGFVVHSWHIAADMRLVHASPGGAIPAASCHLYLFPPAKSRHPGFQTLDEGRGCEARCLAQIPLEIMKTDSSPTPSTGFPDQIPATRRDFIKSSATVALGGVLATQLRMAGGVHAAGVHV